MAWNNALDVLYEPVTPENADDSYYPGSAQYSPSKVDQPSMDAMGLPVVTIRHRPNPLLSMSTCEAAAIPAPPSPSVGGKPGLLAVLGWSTGLRQSRSMRQRFTGMTLVRPSMGVHNADGPVGFSTRTDRLALNVDALYNEWLPSQRVIQESFTKPAQAAGREEH